MTDLWLLLGLAGIAGVIAMLYLRSRREEPVCFADEREESLTSRLSQMVGCSLSRAQLFVRQEIEISPTINDDTLLKRAAYHYRQELPERTCHVYRDRTTG